MDKEVKKHKLKQKKITEGNFMHAFAKQIAKEIVIKQEDLERSLRAIEMIKEYIRQEYDKPNSIKSRKRIEKMCLNLLAMENCSVKSITDAVCKTECTVLDESMDHMIGLNGIEMSLLMKNSHFSRVQKKAEKLMDECTANNVISNGNDYTPKQSPH
tara:strand:- start:708 stop:1178 length:471 start_codon:yes stop_codon:yes gene_type:complete